MNNELTTTNTATASLLEIRRDPQRFPRIGAYSRPQAVFEMKRIISQAFLYRGQTADPTNIEFIATALVDELQTDLDRKGTRDISFAEIQRIVKRAVLQDEMYGISVASLYKVIIEYMDGEGLKLCRQVAEERRREDEQSLKESILAPMLQVYAGQMIKKCKV